jgi:hypothetical protein
MAAYLLRFEKKWKNQRDMKKELERNFKQIVDRRMLLNIAEIYHHFKPELDKEKDRKE